MERMIQKKMPDGTSVSGIFKIVDDHPLERCNNVISLHLVFCTSSCTMVNTCPMTNNFIDFPEKVAELLVSDEKIYVVTLGPGGTPMYVHECDTFACTMRQIYDDFAYPSAELVPSYSKPTHIHVLHNGFENNNIKATVCTVDGLTKCETFVLPVLATLELSTAIIGEKMHIVAINYAFRERYFTGILYRYTCNWKGYNQCITNILYNPNVDDICQDTGLICPCNEPCTYNVDAAEGPKSFYFEDAQKYYVWYRVDYGYAYVLETDVCDVTDDGSIGPCMRIEHGSTGSVPYFAFAPYLGAIVAVTIEYAVDGTVLNFITFNADMSGINGYPHSYVVPITATDYVTTCRLLDIVPQTGLMRLTVSSFDGFYVYDVDVFPALKQDDKSFFEASTGYSDTYLHEPCYYKEAETIVTCTSRIINGTCMQRHIFAGGDFAVPLIEDQECASKPGRGVQKVHPIGISPNANYACVSKLGKYSHFDDGRVHP